MSKEKLSAKEDEKKKIFKNVGKDKLKLATIFTEMLMHCKVRESRRRPRKVHHDPILTIEDILTICCGDKEERKDFFQNQSRGHLLFDKIGAAIEQKYIWIKSIEENGEEKLFSSTEIVEIIEKKVFGNKDKQIHDHLMIANF